MGQRHPQCYLVSLQGSAAGSRGPPYAQNRACPLFATGERACRLPEAQGSRGTARLYLMHLVAGTDGWYEEGTAV